MQQIGKPRLPPVCRAEITSETQAKQKQSAYSRAVGRHEENGGKTLTPEGTQTWDEITAAEGEPKSGNRITANICDSMRGGIIIQRKLQNAGNAAHA
ncbi:MAG: hypothetical protein LBP78_06210, partial [Acidaminococcales bacterium]|nr:hypothetical protein [Acidaminococcales bacterium]